MGLEQKWNDDPAPLQPIKNENLVCKHCMNKTKAVASCEAYDVKPVSVLKGGVCYEYRKSSN